MNTKLSCCERPLQLGMSESTDAFQDQPPSSVGFIEKLAFYLPITQEVLDVYGTAQPFQEMVNRATSMAAAILMHRNVHSAYQKRHSSRSLADLPTLTEQGNVAYYPAASFSVNNLKRKRSSQESYRVSPQTSSINKSSDVPSQPAKDANSIATHDRPTRASQSMNASS